MENTMRTYTYKTTKAFAGSVGAGQTIEVQVPDSLAECVDPAAGGGTPYFPDEKAVVIKAVAQLNIAAVHRAAEWAEKEVKAGRSVTVADIQAKVAGFRYGSVSTRAPGEGGGTKIGAKDAREAVASLDAAVQAALDGKFGKQALDTLIDVGTLKLNKLRAAAEGRENLPPAVQKVLTERQG